MRWVQVAPPGGGATVTLVTWCPTMPPGSLTGLVIGCDDVEATYEELNARGVPVGAQGGIQDAHGSLVRDRRPGRQRLGRPAVPPLTPPPARQGLRAATSRSSTCRPTSPIPTQHTTTRIPAARSTVRGW
jgi:hypothetical protein